MRHTIALIGLALLCGCARYEYQVVAPPEAAGHVGRKLDHTFQFDPLEYRLRTVDNRLVMRIYNRIEGHITLLGGRSSVVDPDGQSHPLQTQTMAPDSFIKLILPPPRPRVYRSGPVFGVGVGTRIGAARGAGYGARDWPYHGPHYLTVYDDDDTYYWRWKGQGQVRLNLVYTRGEAGDQRQEMFTHEFVIRRVRAR